MYFGKSKKSSKTRTTGKSAQAGTLFPEQCPERSVRNRLKDSRVKETNQYKVKNKSLDKKQCLKIGQ